MFAKDSCREMPGFRRDSCEFCLLDRHVVCKSGGVSVGFAVALLAEGVGRNKRLEPFRLPFLLVALLAEGVGRNPPPAHERETV